MHAHETQPASPQPQSNAPKANPFAPRPFEMAESGQGIGVSASNPFPRRPHEVWMGEPAVSLKSADAVASPEPEVKLGESGWLQFSLYAPDRPAPASTSRTQVQRQAKSTAETDEKPGEVQAKSIDSQTAAAQPESPAPQPSLTPTLPQRPSPTWIWEPYVSPHPASQEAQPDSETKPSESNWLKFDLYAAGQAPPNPPRGAGVQAKLSIGRPNDAYEQEADRVAEQVMSMAPPATPNVQRQTEAEVQAKCEACEGEESIQRTVNEASQVIPVENRLIAIQRRIRAPHGSGLAGGPFIPIGVACWIRALSHTGRFGDDVLRRIEYDEETRQWNVNEGRDEGDWRQAMFDAWGHCYIAACLGRRVPEHETWAAGTFYEILHEAFSQVTLGIIEHDSLTQDLYNQAVGRDIGLHQPDGDLYEICFNAMMQGRLDLTLAGVARGRALVPRAGGSTGTRVQRKETDTSVAGGTNLETQLNQSKGGGSPLPPEVRSFMEPRFGTDFSQVRVHTGAEAVQMNRAVGAKAFAHKQDIYYGAGESPRKDELTAHELTHVVQQTGGVKLNKIAQRQILADEKLEQTPQISSKMLPGLNSVGTSNQRSQPHIDLKHIDLKQEPQHGSGITSLPAKELSNQQPSLNLNPVQPGSRLSLTEPETGETAFSGGPLSAKTLAEDDHSNNFQPFTSLSLDMGSIETHESAEISIQPKLLADFSPSLNQSSGVQLSVDSSLPLLQTQTDNLGSPNSSASLTSVAAEPSALMSAPNLIQRGGDDDSDGLLGGIQNTINRLVEGLRSGWSGLSEMAQGAFEGLRGQFSSIAEGLGSLVSSALAGIQGGWAALSQMATQLTNGIQQQLQGAIGTITGAVSAIGQAIVNMDAAALQAAFGRVTGLIGSVFQQVQQAGQAVFERINSLWNGLQGRFNDVLGNLANRASQIFTQLQTAAEGVRQRLTSAWAALQNRASQMSGVLGGVLERLRSLVDRLLSWGQQIWNGIQQQWTGLQGRLQGFLQGVRQQITNALQRLRQQATQMWQRVQGLWQRMQQWVRQQVHRVLHSARSIWDSIRQFDIGQIVQAILHYAPFLQAAYEAAQNPDSLLQPIAQQIAVNIEGGMPAAAEQKAREHTGGGGQVAKTTDQSTSNIFIQRQPLNQGLDQSTLWRGFWEVLVEKWGEVSQDIPGTILNMLYESIAFWDTIPREWDGLKSDLAKAVERMNTAGLGFLRHLIDIPLIILRRAKNILLALYPWFTLLSTVVGAIAGGMGGTAVGGILGFMAGGAPAAPGAAAGAGVGIAGGAGIGLGFALGVGEALFAADMAIEAVSLVKAWTDLSLVEQTAQEQVEDLNQMVNSAIAVAIAGILWAASAAISSAFAGKIAQGFLRRLRSGGAALRFIQGVDRGFRGGSPFRRGGTRDAEGGTRDGDAEGSTRDGESGTRDGDAESGTRDGDAEGSTRDGDAESGTRDGDAESGTRDGDAEGGTRDGEGGTRDGDAEGGTRDGDAEGGTRDGEGRVPTREEREGSMRDRDAESSTRDGEGRVPTREERLQELARDPDHGGKVTPGSLREAEVALSLEEAGRLERPVRRPQAGESGDFVDATGQEWDVKAPRSRERLIEAIREQARQRSKPEPNIPADRPMRGEFTVEGELEVIRGEIRTGEKVIIDTQNLTPQDAAALRQAVQDAGLDGQVIFYP